MGAVVTVDAARPFNVHGGLRTLFPADSYALFFEVGDGTGSLVTRRADAVVQCLWPSRGLWLAGVEIKVSRADWLRELADPAKADAIHRFCDHWYLAVSDAEIVRAGELPDGWGLLAPRAGKLAVKVRPAKLAPQPITAAFRAALLRAAQDAGTDHAAIAQAREEAYRKGKERAARDAKYAIENAERARDDAKAALASIEQHVGRQVSSWDARDIGAAMVLYEKLRHRGHAASRLSGAADELRGIAAQIDAMRDVVAGLVDPTDDA